MLKSSIPKHLWTTVPVNEHDIWEVGFYAVTILSYTRRVMWALGSASQTKSLLHIYIGICVHFFKFIIVPLQFIRDMETSLAVIPMYGHQDSILSSGNKLFSPLVIHISFESLTMLSKPLRVGDSVNCSELYGGFCFRILKLGSRLKVD